MAATLDNVLVSCLHLSEVFLSWSVREMRRESNPNSTSATLASSWTNLQGHRSTLSSAPTHHTLQSKQSVRTCGWSPFATPPPGRTAGACLPASPVVLTPEDKQGEGCGTERGVALRAREGDMQLRGLHQMTL